MACVALTIAEDVTGAARSDDAAASQPIVDLATFFDVSLDLLVIRDLEGRIVKVSRSWETILGYHPDDLAGLAILDMVHPDDMPDTRNSVVEVESRKVGDPVLGHVNRYRHRLGSYRTLEWRAQRFGDRIYAVARDVTDRVAADRALIEAKAAAEAASHAKSDFLANMSHEIRTPLNGVIGIVDALARTAMTPEQAEMVELIRTSGVTLERLVSDILDVSKIEAGQLDLESRAFDLDEALEAPIDVMRNRAEDKGLTFRVERTADARGLFLGDSTRIRQILGNLLSNAVKFTAQGGVVVRVDVESAEDALPRLSIMVEDTGVGFDADHAARLFERFNQADATITRRFGGSGLGMSICRSLVEMMDGEIEARSTPGVGSLFRISLPLMRVRSLAEYDAREATTMSASAPAPQRPLRILLAEDHPTNQRVVQLILDSQDAELTIVPDGAQAVAAFEAGTFDVVLMDMQMPVMDGLTATRAIRALEAVTPARGRTPVVMLSANAMTEHRQEAAAAGADIHVAKPITAASLLAGIHIVIAGRAGDHALFETGADAP